MAAYLPISNGLFTWWIDICFIMVCGFITAICVALGSSINGLISGFNGYGFATATGTYGFIATTTNENGSSLRDGTIIAIVAQIEIGFNNTGCRV